VVHGDLTGKVLRIGHMGPTAYPLSPVIALTALGRALRGFDVEADVGAAVDAALDTYALVLRERHPGVVAVPKRRCSTARSLGSSAVRQPR